jgi:hypothetical protein
MKGMNEMTQDTGIVASQICGICGGKIGFTSSEFRRHEATKRHTDAEAEALRVAGEIFPDGPDGSFGAVPVEVVPVETVVAEMIAGDRTFTGSVLGILGGSLRLAPEAPAPAQTDDWIPATPAEVETDEGQQALERAAKAAQKARRLAQKEPKVTEAEPVAETGTPEAVEVSPEAAAPSSRKAKVAELKAIRMRQKWAAQRAERRAEKAQASGSPDAAKLVKVAAAEWKKEREAYAVYHKALVAK